MPSATATTTTMIVGISSARSDCRKDGGRGSVVGAAGGAPVGSAVAAVGPSIAPTAVAVRSPSVAGTAPAASSAARRSEALA